MTNPLADAITFLFTDIEGSTKLWESHPDAMRLALRQHDALLKEIFKKHRGQIFKTLGDAFCVAFSEISDALAATLEAQCALQKETYETIGRLRVRMALHTGSAEARDGDYFGPTLNRCARLLAIAHGDQILISSASESHLRPLLNEATRLIAMGEHRLRDLAKPERVYQIVHPELPREFPPLRSLSFVPNNLPLQLTSFIGRESELAQLRNLIAGTAPNTLSVRLITLTGAGGCGKTRLSLQVGAELTDAFADGVWLIELASVSDPVLLAHAVAMSLGLREQEHVAMTEILSAYLQPREILLIWDNCEHLLNECAQLVDTLLKRCPKLRVLASSRESLNIPGETTFPLAPLPLPSLHASTVTVTHADEINALSRCESIKLFVERAMTVVPDFALTPQNAPRLAQICRQLDGIPLAIELAAARVKAFSVEQIAARLDDCFKLLTGGSRAALPRQQTLKAAMDWGYDLLSEPERALLRRLSVFSNGFTLEAAEAVCGEVHTSGTLWVQESDVFLLLSNLVDKSLVLVEERGEATRYRLLETVRQYARDKLVEAHEAESFRRRQRDYFVKWAEALEAKLAGPDQDKWLKRIEQEHDNLRAAFDWSISMRESEASLKLAGDLWFFWHVHGDWSEGRVYLESAFAARHGTESQPTLAKALHGAGVLAWRQGDYARATEAIQQSWVLYKTLKDKKGMAYAPNVLGLIAHHQGDDARAKTLLEESLTLFRELEDKRGIAYALNILGLIAHREGDNLRAEKLCEESLALRRELQDKRGVALALRLLGGVVLHQGDLKRAATLYKDGLDSFRELGDQWGMANTLWQLGRLTFYLGDSAQAETLFRESLVRQRELANKADIVACLEGLAMVATAQQKNERALLLFGVAEALREQIGAPLPLAERAEHEHQVARVRAGVSTHQSAALWDRGRAMTLETAIEYALAPLLHRGEGNA